MIKMKKQNRTVEIKDHSLIEMYEQAGWTKSLDAHVEVKATVKPPKKKFTEVNNDDSDAEVVTPSENDASNNN